MQSLKSKASKFFKPSQCQSDKSEVKATPLPPAPLDSEDEFDAFTSEGEGENVTSNIQIGKNEKLKKKPSRFLIHKSSTQISSGPSTGNSLRSKTSRLFSTSSMNSIRSTNRTSNSSFGSRARTPSGTATFLSSTVFSFNPPLGPAPQRPPRPDSLDEDIIALMRENSRVCLLSGATHSPRSSNSTTASSGGFVTIGRRTFHSSLSHRLSAASQASNLAANVGSSDEMTTEQVRTDGKEYTYIRRSVGSGLKGPGELWKDDGGFLHFVPDI